MYKLSNTTFRTIACLAAMVLFSASLVATRPSAGEVKAAADGTATSTADTSAAPTIAANALGARFEQGATLFTDRPYKAAKLPAELADTVFLRSAIDYVHVRCKKPGIAYALTPTPGRPGATSQHKTLTRLGFRKLALPEFQLFGDHSINRVSVYRRMLEAGEEIELGKWTVMVFPAGTVVERYQGKPWGENRGELLYNGIRLPERWPPRHLNPKSREPRKPPYLEHVPAVIPIDVGRQLFVDDFLIEETTMERRFHQPEKFAGNPVLRPETPLELNGGKCPVACPFSDGVFYDSDQRCFKMWYHAGWFDGTAYATSGDGLHWRRPELDVEPGTNRVIAKREDFRRDGVSVWLDHEADDAAARFKMFLYARSGKYPHGGRLLTSPDGIHWTERGLTGPLGDNTTFFYNPFRKRWVFSIRSSHDGRTRDYWEHPDFLAAAAGRWVDRQPVYWIGADRLDRPDPEIGRQTQLYKVDAVGYESLMLGLLQIHYGPPNEVCRKGKFPKLTELQVAFSRDGFYWHRPCRETFIGASRKPGDWQRGYIHSVGGCCLVVGDQLYFYYGAFSGVSPEYGGDLYAGAATGLARLRRDGFASMHAGPDGGTLVTRRLTFTGRCLFVNTATSGGRLKAEILDADGKPIEPFTVDRCQPVSCDSTIARIDWSGADDLSRLAGKPVRFRFHLASGDLYAFWVAPDESGASRGYVGAGGPGFENGVDMAGLEAYGKP